MDAISPRLLTAYETLCARFRNPIDLKGRQMIKRRAIPTGADGRRCSPLLSAPMPLKAVAISVPAASRSPPPPSRPPRLKRDPPPCALSARVSRQQLVVARVPNRTVRQAFHHAKATAARFNRIAPPAASGRRLAREEKSRRTVMFVTAAVEMLVPHGKDSRF